MARYCIVYTRGGVNNAPRIMGEFKAEEAAYEEAACIACTGGVSWLDDWEYSPKQEMLWDSCRKRFYLGRERLWVVPVEDRRETD